MGVSKEKIMKALSIKQPYATLIANGIKTLEVRSWRTNYRGSLVIVSSKQPDREAMLKYPLQDAPQGVTVALVELVDIREGQKKDRKAALVDPAGRFVWELRVIRKLPPISVKGQLNLYPLPKAVARRCGVET